MDDNKKCENCLYFSRKRDAEICRRYPPKIFFDEELVKNITVYPEVSKDDWCGEGRCKENEPLYELRPC
ncbi:MAG: hypothetical protein ACXAAH_00270 [Promethearchaeota archaeon]|jgi:hypothetical protein